MNRQNIILLRLLGFQGLRTRIAWQLRDDIKITRAHARVIFNMCAFYFQCPLTLFAWGEKFKGRYRVGEMKKCLGWHFEYCVRRVPTLRSERNT